MNHTLKFLTAFIEELRKNFLVTNVAFDEYIKNRQIANTSVSLGKIRIKNNVNPITYDFKEKKLVIHRPMKTNITFLKPADDGAECIANRIFELMGEENNPKQNEPGSKTSFYDINVDGLETIDVDYIAMAYGFTFAEGNVLKALVGIAKERSEGKTRHDGTDEKRDRNKLLHYSQLVHKSVK